MCASGTPESDAAALARALSDVIPTLGSLDEVRRWLLSQPHVTTVVLADHLIKVNPPWWEFRVTLAVPDRSPVLKAIDVSARGGELHVHGIHDV